MTDSGDGICGNAPVNGTASPLFLLSAVRALFPPHTRVGMKVPAGVSGGDLLRCAASHGVSPLLARLATETPSVALPPGAEERLRRAAEQAEANHETTLAALASIADTMRADGIPCAALKGPWLYETLYRNRFPRPYSDLDLLIPAARLDDGIAALAKLGYRLAERPWIQPFLKRFHFHVPLRPSRGTWPPVELHWRLEDRFNLHRIPHGDVFSRLQEWRIGASTMGALSPPDELVYLCLHASKHGILNEIGLRHGCPAEWFCQPVTGNRLLWFLDIALWMEKQGEGLRWSELAEQLRRWNVRDEVASVLRLVHLLIPESRTGEALDRLGEPTEAPARSPGTLTQWINRPAGQRFLARMNTANPAVTIRPVRLLALWRLFLPGPGRLRTYYGGSRWMVPALCLWHPFHLAWRILAGR